MNELVFLTNNSLNNAEAVTNHEVIAKCANNEARAIAQLIKKYRNDLENLGVLTFEMSKPQKGTNGGRPRKIYLLNRNQAMLVITWLDNTEVVRSFKLALIKRFDEMEKELMQHKLNRIEEKPVGKTLRDAINDWEHKNAYSFGQVTDLCLKYATGKIARVLKKERCIDNSLNGLTPAEQKRYETAEHIAIGLIRVNKKYQDIKGIINQLDLVESERVTHGSIDL